MRRSGQVDNRQHSPFNVDGAFMLSFGFHNQLAEHPYGGFGQQCILSQVPQKNGPFFHTIQQDMISVDRLTPDLPKALEIEENTRVKQVLG